MIAGLLVFAALRIASAVQLPARTFTLAEGLPSELTNCAVSDPRGFLWVCTFEGLARFDGYSFHLYTTADGLPHRVVNDAMFLGNGSLLVATNGGLVRMDSSASSKFISVAMEGAPPPNGFDTILRSRRGFLWIAGPGIVCRLDKPEDPASKLRVVHKEPLSSIAEDDEARLWLTTPPGVVRLSPDGGVPREWRLSALRDATGSLERLSIRGIYPGPRRNHFWLATLEGLWLLRIDADGDSPPMLVRHWTTHEGLSSDRILGILPARRPNSLWLPTGAGLSELSWSAGGEEVHFRILGAAQGIPGRTVLNAAEDRWGNLWINGDQGLTRVSRRGFVRFNEADGLGELSIPAVKETRDGEIVAVSNDPDTLAFRRFNEGRFHKIAPNYAGVEHFSWGTDQNVLLDREGDWWVATVEGLARFPHVQQISNLAHTPPRIVYTKLNSGLESSDVMRLFEDSRGDIWIGPEYGRPSVLRRATGKIEPISASRVVSDTLSIAEDRAGGIWMSYLLSERDGSTSFGLMRMGANGEYREFGAVDGVPPGGVQAMVTDRNGRLWLATGEGGLGVFDDPAAHDPKARRFPARLLSHGGSCLAEDREGNIWIGSSKGLHRVTPETAEVRFFGAAEGYPKGGCSVLRVDSKGQLWVGTSRGLGRYDPGGSEVDEPPSVYLTNVTINGAAQAGLDLADCAPFNLGGLRYDRNQVRIEYSSPAAVDGRTIQYKYRLIGGTGASAGWSELGDQRTVDYPGLPPGRYRFEVVAVGEGRHESRRAAVMDFRIAPPFWRRWWFETLVAATVAAAIVLLYRFQLSKRIALEQLRSGIAADLHDDLGASLSRIAIMSEVVRRGLETDPEGSRHRLAEIADSARGMVDGLSELVWSIDPRKDDMASVLRRVREFASDILETQGIEWALDAQSAVLQLRLDAGKRRHVYLIMKEAITNAARHAQCHSVRMHASVEGRQCVVTITDDGRGLGESRNGGGNGLKNMAERAKVLGGALTMEQQGGLRVILRFPA